MSKTIVKIISRHSGKVLEVEGGSKHRRAAIQQNVFTGRAHQLWELVHTSRDGRIKLVSRSSDMLMVPNGTPIQQYDDLDMPDQQWRLEQVDDGYVALISVENGLALSLSEPSSENGVHAELQANRHRAHQQWQLDVADRQRID